MPGLVALPETRMTGLPRSEPSTLNWTLPVALDGVTAAVKVTEAP